MSGNKAPSTVKLNDLNDSIQYWRDVLRNRLKNPASQGIDENQIIDAIDQRVKLRDGYLQKNNPDVLNNLREAELSTKDYKDAFSRSLVGSLIQRGSNGLYVMSDKTAMARMLRVNDNEAWTEFGNVLAQYPEAKQRTAETLLALYKQNYTKGGLPMVDLHQKFLKDYSEAIPQVFGAEDQKTLAQLHDVADMVGRNREALDDFGREIKRQIRIDPTQANPESLASMFFGSGRGGMGLDNVYNMRHIAEGMDALNGATGTMLKNWQSTVGGKLYSMVFKNGTPNTASLGTLLDESGPMRGKIRALFGDQYVKDLDTLYSGMRMAESSALAPALPAKNTLWTDLARVFWAKPLTAEGRVVTLAQNQRSRSYAQFLYQAFYDPTFLRKMIANQQQNTTSAVWRRLQVQAGVSLSNFDTPPSDTPMASSSPMMDTWNQIKGKFH